MSLTPESIVLLRDSKQIRLEWNLQRHRIICKLSFRINFSRIHFLLSVRHLDQNLPHLPDFCRSLTSASARTPANRPSRGIDLVCNMSRTAFGFQHILVIVCYLSKFFITRPLKTKTSREILVCLQDIYLSIGVPKILQHDKGTEFSSKVIPMQFCSRI